ncbi:MAG: C2HC-type zinc finger protein [Candidatus Peribacteraceae bacterium]|nr:C2HC-type zinc finger protein [Candidatus Peribacteraceae bacterium]
MQLNSDQLDSGQKKLAIKKANVKDYNTRIAQEYKKSAEDSSYQPKTITFISPRKERAARINKHESQKAAQYAKTVSQSVEQSNIKPSKNKFDDITLAVKEDLRPMLSQMIQEVIKSNVDSLIDQKIASLLATKETIDLVTCEKCGKKFKPKGLKRHIGACNGRSTNDASNDSKLSS